MAVDHSKRIAEIQDVLRTGARTVVADGLTVTYDFESLRKELRQLMAEDPVYSGRRRPAVSSFNLGGSF